MSAEDLSSSDAGRAGPGLTGRGLVVVGATSGIGRALALDALDRGANVVGTGRRPERLAELRAAGASAVEVDVADPRDCAALAAAVSSSLQSVDAVVNCAGAAPLRRLVDMASEEWSVILGANLVGANNLVVALLPVLSPSAVVAVISSDSAGAPPFALGAYAAGKAALETLWHGWRVEEPARRFCTFALGPTFPTEFGRHFDDALLQEAVPHWNRSGFAWNRLVDTEEVAGLLADMVASLIDHPGLSVEHMLVRSPGARAGASDSGAGHG